MGEIHGVEGGEIMSDEKPWLYKPGQSGNPSGKPKRSEEEVLMRENFKSALIAMGTKSISEIEAIARDPNSPLPYVIQAKAISFFLKHGSPAYYKEFLDRTIGKVPQETTISGDISVRPHKEMSDNELEQRIKALAGRETLPPGE